MGTFNFRVTRDMEGDKPYKDGDKRELLVSEAEPMVRSGALVPADKAAEDAMAALLGSRDGWGVRPAMSTDHEAVAAAAVSPFSDAITGAETPAKGPKAAAKAAAKKAAAKAAAKKAAAAPAKNKDAGDAPANKDGRAPEADKGEGGGPASDPPVVEPVTLPAATPAKRR